MSAEHPSLLKGPVLKEWAGCRQNRKLEAWLAQRGIPYWYGGDGEIVTTLEAVNAALITRAESATIEFAGRGKETQRAA